MDQGSDHIRQNIEDTRDALTEKLDALETRARETFDLKHQVAERPWMALGAAVAAGYMLGSLGGSDEPSYSRDTSNDWAERSPYGQRSASSGPSRSQNFLSQFDDEIALLKGAAMTTLTNFLHDTIREVVPALGAQLTGNSSTASSSASSSGYGTPTTAQGASLSDYRDRPTINTEAIPTTTSYGSNAADQNAAHATPYYPPGSNSDTYRSASGTRERSVNEENTRF